MSELTQTVRAAVPVLVPDPVTYREYKLLLRSDHFVAPGDYHKFWKLTRRVAKAVGIEIRKRGKPMETHLREVLFFDTPKFRLYNNGFMLRRRMFYKKGLPQPNHELTLKFRHPDHDTAALVDVRPLLPCIHTIKFKEEVLMKPGEHGSMRTVYSHACELDTPNVILTQSFESITQVFPAMLRTGAKAKTLLSVVNGVAIEEILVNFGEIDFAGKATAKATLAIWRNRMTQEHLVGEYSYQLKFSNAAGFQGKARELSDAFFLKLQEDGEHWLHMGTTKTAMVYGLGKTAVTNHE
ncbi:MAG TPA: hypothetical protein VJN94_05845 [Candidatus Binataceae bacterium]|nr:hypothetical protein [Candidatus Binataceae bacterium]